MAGKINMAEYSFDISVNNAAVKTAFDQAEKQADTSANNILKTFSESSKKVTDSLGGLNALAGGFTNAGKSMLLGITTPILGVLGLAGKSASDLEQTNRRTQQIYGDMADSVNEWALANESAYGLGAGTIANYVGQIGDLSQGLGLSKEASLDMAKGATELSVQLANWGGYKTDEVINDMNKALTGSYEGLQKYGIKLNETALEETARNMGLQTAYKDLDNATKAQVIYEASLAASQNAIEYWDEGNRGMAFYLGKTKEMLGNVAENLGNVFLPYVNKAVEKVADLAKKFSDWSAENPELLKTITKIGLALAAIGPIFLIIGKGISIFTQVKGAIAGVQAVLTLMGTSLSGILIPIGLVVAGVAGLAYAWTTNFGGIRDTTAEIFGSVKEIITTILTNIQSAWDNNFYGIKDVADTILTYLKQLFNTVFTALADIFKIFSALFKGDWEGMWNAVKNFATNLWNNLKNLFSKFMDMLVQVLFSVGTALFDAAVFAFTKVKEGFEQIWKAITTWWEKAKEDPAGMLTSIGTSMFNAGKSVFSSVWDGMKSIWSDISNWVSNKVSWLVDKLAFWRNGKSEMNSGSSGGGSGSNRPYSMQNLNSYAIGNNEIKTSGLALLHQGEMVMPRDYNPFNSNRLAKELAGQLGGVGGDIVFNPIINVDANSNVDIDVLKRQLSKEWVRDLKKLGIKTR